VSTQAQNEALASRLEGVLGRGEALHLLLEEPGPLSEALRPCFHGLQHYLADEDIRAKDEKYRQMQENEMLALISLLRTGADPSRVARISFLSPTEA
jgi:hypothetical protein